MEKTKVSIAATIPVYQYANLQPTVEAEADTFEEARDMALTRMKTIWDSVAEGGKKLDVSTQTAPATLVPKICTFTRHQVLMDEASHTYQDADGNRYLSGSAFANRYKEKFDSQLMANASAKKHGVKAEDLLNLWSINSEASTSFGTAVHAGLEMYGKYLELSKKTKNGTDEAALHKNPVIAGIVLSFYQGRENEEALYEAFVANSDKHLCGFIDRLLVVDKENRVVRVQDYKTNPNIHKKKKVLAPFTKVVDNTELGHYWLQLSFYAYILELAGYTVEGLDIFNYDGEKWTAYSHDVVDISGEIK